MSSTASCIETCDSADPKVCHTGKAAMDNFKNKNKNIYLSFLAIHTALMITANMFELYDVIVWALMDANST